MIVLIIALVVGLAWAGKRLADEKIESALAEHGAQQAEAAAEFDAHTATALDLLDPATPHLGWPAGIVPLTRAQLYRAHHDRRGGAR